MDEAGTAAGISRLVSRLPTKIRSAIEQNEAKGRFDDPAYKKAAAEFVRRHYSDLRVRPYNEQMETFNTKLMNEMGFSDAITLPIKGSLTGWNVVQKLKQIHIPTLVTVGARDLATPACARTIQRGIRGSKLVVFKESGHDAFSKERDLYIETVGEFLDSVQSRKSSRLR